MTDLIHLRVRPDFTYLSRGRTVLAMNRDGFLDAGPECGLFVHETRLLSRYRLLVNGRPPQPVVLSNIEQHSWMGYYITVSPEVDTGPRDTGSGRVEAESQQTLELRSSKVVGEGLHEDLDLTNFTQHPARFTLAIELDADFADLAETNDERRQTGERSVAWRQATRDRWELSFHYHARHEFSVQDESGVAEIRRGLVVRIARASSSPVWRDGQVQFDVALAPRTAWHACLTFAPLVESVELSTPAACFGSKGDDAYGAATRMFLAESASLTAPGGGTLTTVVLPALQQARRDLAALRLHDLDVGPRAWTVAAGAPIYVALFGRDTLTAAWQAAILGSEMLRGTLAELARWQGGASSDWRDEDPGRMLHEMHTGPLEALNVNPRGRSYSSVTTSGFFPFVLAELWHWTGDRDLVRSLVPAASRALEWVDRNGDLDGDGFYEYRTRSADGVRHQAWKDSGDSMVYDDGRQVEPPIATCEEQAFVYVAKFAMAEVLWWLGESDRARRLLGEAAELKKRFNDAFWMEDAGFVAMALDAAKQPVRSIASNAGHCIATGILTDERVPRAAARLMADDLFSGWGVRTLSSDHPAFNPYSYHRGSVWPVEQGTFALGFFRYGLWGLLDRLARAQFEAAALFDFHRLPEVFSGHPRNEAHPFPALYPRANSPQAWSASAVFCYVQAMLGLYPYAPLHALIVDPHLPPWLPEITLRNLRVGSASVSLRLFRTADGGSDYEVLDERGRLHVVRQPSPWSLTANFAERLRDLVASLAR